VYFLIIEKTNLFFLLMYHKYALVITMTSILASFDPYLSMNVSRSCMDSSYKRWISSSCFWNNVKNLVKTGAVLTRNCTCARIDVDFNFSQIRWYLLFLVRYVSILFSLLALGKSCNKYCFSAFQYSSTLSKAGSSVIICIEHALW
jgi:hypothetical protein